jgi:tetratricopeptide (TPR) repeat protein
MPKGFRVRAWQALACAGFAVAVAGCASLRPKPPGEAPAESAAESGSVRTYLSLAEMREDGGDWAGALAVVDKALAQSPGNQTLLERRAQLLLLRAGDEDAPELREEARAIVAGLGEADDAEARATIAWLEFEDGRHDDALAAAHAAADAAPDSARMQVILSHLLYRNGDYAGAKRAAERAVELAPRSGAALRQRARTRLAVADLPTAEGDARDVLRAHPYDVASSLILADAQLRQGNAKGARSTLALVPPARRTPAVLVALAQLEIAAGNAAEGRTLLQEAVAARPNDPAVHETLVALDIREGRAGESVARLDAAVAARPDDAELHRLRGVALGADRRDSEAAASFARSLALDPNELDTYLALVEFLRTRTQSSETERRAAELGIGAGPTFFTIGLLREASGDRSGARAHFQKALEADPSLVVAGCALAASLAASGENLDQALALARAARAARPGDPSVADTLGLVHLRRGQSAVALEVLGDAVGTESVWSPRFAMEVFHASMAFEASGDRESARRTAEIALAVTGDRKPEPAWAGNARAIIARSKPAPKPAAESVPTPATPPASETPKP